MINLRMDRALHQLTDRWPKRRPKAFYLVPHDWAAFMAVERPTIRTMFGNNPPRERVDPAFSGIPVRESKGQHSRLYDNTASGHPV
jgi:hypothetical protein